MMLLSKLKVAGAVVLVTAFLGGAAGLVTPVIRAQGPKSKLAAEQVAQSPKTDRAWEQFQLKEKADLADLEGAWEVVSRTTNGKPAGGTFKYYRWTFKDQHVTTEYELEKPVKEAARGSNHRFTVNPAKNPKEITLYSANGLVQGIYKREGDTLTICTFGEHDRPKGFAVADAGSDQFPLMVFILKPEKK